MAQKKTYRFWVNGKGWHEFRSFRIYWAYRWYIAEQRDIKGVPDPRDRTGTRLVPSNDAEMYSLSA